MRHLKAGRKLNRNSSHRRAMFRNMANSLFAHEMIKTTLPKAKELKRVAEPLITLAKTDSVANRRLAFSRLRDKDAVSKLFNELAPRFVSRQGGYLSVLKCGFRRGDAAPMALVMFVRTEDVVQSGMAHQKASTVKESKQTNESSMTQAMLEQSSDQQGEDGEDKAIESQQEEIVENHSEEAVKDVVEEVVEEVAGKAEVSDQRTDSSGEDDNQQDSQSSEKSEEQEANNSDKK